MPGTQAHKNTPTSICPVFPPCDIFTYAQRAHPGDRTILPPSMNYNQENFYQKHWLWTLFLRRLSALGYIISPLCLYKESHTGSSFWIGLLWDGDKWYKIKWCVSEHSRGLIVLSTAMWWFVPRVFNSLFLYFTTKYTFHANILRLNKKFITVNPCCPLLARFFKI